MFIGFCFPADEDTRGATRKVKRVPHFEQGKRETEQAFFNRMEIEAQRAMNVAKFEEKFEVQMLYYMY